MKRIQYWLRQWYYYREGYKEFITNEVLPSNTHIIFDIDGRVWIKYKSSSAAEIPAALSIDIFF